MDKTVETIGSLILSGQYREAAVCLQLVSEDTYDRIMADYVDDLPTCRAYRLWLCECYLNEPEVYQQRVLRALN